MSEPVIYRCPICGIPVDKDLISKRKSRGIENPDYCFDCLDSGKPMRKHETWSHPVLGKIECVPHKGDVDDDFRPLTPRGTLFMAGYRICGRADCVRKNHVVRMDDDEPYGLSAIVKQVFETTGVLISLDEAKGKTPANFVGQQGLLRGDQ